MYRSISLQEWIVQSASLPLIDVRTPAEFTQGHIPGAQNVPIFSNEERVQVGTTYKQIGREPAILLGFELVGPKWAELIRQCLLLAPGKRIAVHCWRGGMRSGALAWALNFYGFEVYQVQGGYKAYRRWTLQQLQRSFNLRILGGKTGSGKTEWLHQLKAAGRQVIDLEAIAQHQGSSYGTMNRMVQPSQEHFENLLAWRLKDIDPAQPLWLEDESRRIGKREIPKDLWEQIRSAPMLDLQLPLETRVARLAAEYGVLDKDFLVECTERIGRRLGPEQTRDAVRAIREDRMPDFIRIVLFYYDKTYRKGLSMRDAQKVTALDAEALDSDSLLQSLLAFP
ncbi:tRNA 2-selenouridine(34) synthase MnmH [Rurimicrobium arvi]|uniref:tRNA 2-selenouridine(34) synthase MnmH n=1 Tax=Rurimicrobium arvi TaxID=2049916 RepID=A0ABP8MP77_9BACT